jgi:UDP-N-acetylglucosamine 2-epimerase (non-hydrolysing)
MTKKIVLVLGIRPDIIRASIFINRMRAELGKNFVLVWSGQHYSDNLKDIFFKELGVSQPDFELGIAGTTDAELVGDLLPKLSKVLVEIQPSAVIFLGDTNTVAGSIAAAQLNIPIVHIEGCMRSYDWRMPEEKYRKITDHLSDLIFAYLPEYKSQGLAEGIPSQNIEICGNPIVDVLDSYFIKGKLRLTESEFFNLKLEKYGLAKDSPFALMTSHRRENVENKTSLGRVFALAEAADVPVVFPAGYRTQSALKHFEIKVPENIVQVDPIGYLEILELLTHANFVLTDSGTLVEEACILGTPSIQMRHSTERPQVYTWGASVKFDPTLDEDPNEAITKVNNIDKSSWSHGFGNGSSSDFIFNSVIEKLNNDSLSRHQPEAYLPWSKSSFIGDSR